MKRFQPGKLYKCPEHFLLIFPTKEKAMEARPNLPTCNSWPFLQNANGNANDDFEFVRAYWSQKLNCKVQYIRNDTVFMIVDSFDFENKYIKVLSKDKVGWVSVLKNTIFSEIVSYKRE